MKYWSSLWLAVLLMCGLFCVPCVAQGTVITELRFSNAAAVAEENLAVSGYGDKDSGYAPDTNGGRLYASVSGTDWRKLEWSKGEYGVLGMQPVMTGGTKNPWGHGAYLEVRLSTKGYEAITFSADIGATKKGPRDYKLQYSVDGTTFRDVSGATYTVTTNKEMVTAFDNVALPSDAADREQLYVRIAVASNMFVNGTAGLVGSTGGETAVNNVVVRGEAIATTTKATVSTAASTTRTATATTATTAVANTGKTTAEINTVTTTTVASTVSVAAPSSADTADVSQAVPATALLLLGFGAVMLTRRRLAK